jgi:hypothetical protein
MSDAGRVLKQRDASREVLSARSIARLSLELASQKDEELSTWGWVPSSIPTCRESNKSNARSRR